MTFQPTPEQHRALDLFALGGSIAIEAGAGTGKTSTLKLLAASDPKRRGQYIAFNKAIVTEAASTFPENIRCNTAHSLAFRTTGKRYSHRLGGRRMKSSELARRLRINEALWLNVGDGRKGLQPDYLASLVMRTIGRFCQTADDVPDVEHVPYIKGIDLDHGFDNQLAVRTFIRPSIAKAWTDIQDIAGELPFTHAHYLKLWQLGDPHIPADFITFDEAQDASPVMLAAVEAQKHAQLVFVGDSQQQIYEFTGAVNALENVPASDRTYLTQSFRFGGAIADAANNILERLGAELRLKGTPELPSLVGEVDLPDAILTRTNATAVHTVLNEMSRGRPVHLVGGGDEVLQFARGVDDLRARGYTSHPDLACFESWAEVKTYAENDPQGSDLKLLVRLVDEFGTATIKDALGRTIPEGPGVTVVSTAHKAKGREWDRVRLAGDFADDEAKGPMNEGELRLLYVAATRAKRELDPGACRELVDPQPTLLDEPEEVPV